jgi:hypothetical protein
MVRPSAFAAVVGLSILCAHSSWAFQPPRLLLRAGAARRAADASAPAPCSRGGALRLLSPSGTLRSRVLLRGCRARGRALQLEMAREAASGPAVGQVDVGEEEEVQMTAAQMAEEEARRQVSEVVDVMMGETPATMAPAPLGSLPPATVF